MKKRFFWLFLLFFFLLPINVLAERDLSMIGGQNFLIADQADGRILLGHKADEKVPVASTAKIITIYRTLEAVYNGELSWEQRVKMSENLVELSKDDFLGNVEFQADKEYTVLDLFQSALLASSNSATIFLGELISGSNEGFIVETRQWLKDIGLSEFTFVSPSGLELIDLQDFGLSPSDAPHATSATTPGTFNLFSAYDIAVIAYRMIQDFPEVLETASQGNVELSNGETVFTLNAFFEYEENGIWFNGLKTGFTPFAQSSYVGYAYKGDKRVIIVTLQTLDYITDGLELSRLAFTDVANGEMTGSQRTTLSDIRPIKKEVIETKETTKEEEPVVVWQSIQPRMPTLPTILTGIAVLLLGFYFLMKK